MDGPLESRCLLRSADPDAIRDVTGGLTVAHEIALRGRERRIDGVVKGARLGRTTMVFVRYGAPVEIEAPGTGARIAVTVPLGPMRVTGPRTTPDVQTRGFVLDEESPTLMTPDPWAGALVITTDLAVLQRQLRLLTGAAPAHPLRFRGAADGEPPLPAAALDATWRWALAQLDAVGDAAISGPMRRHLEDVLLNALLLGQPHSASALLHDAPPPDASDAAIERARQYIDDHFEQPLSTTQLAREVGASARYLQAGFRRRFGATPVEVLRDVRLQHARRTLLDQTRGSERTVSQIALSCGFRHFGRFAGHYRARFGESPSETARRAAADSRAVGRAGPRGHRDR